MRRALVLHLYYEDVALDLLGRIGALPPDFDVLVTGPLRESRSVAAALRGLGVEPEWIDAPDVGFDVLPFLAVLRVLKDRGCELFAKLHTKRGSSGFARAWRETGIRAAMGSPAVIDAVTEAFAKDGGLGAIGAAELLLSVEINMSVNAASVVRLADAAWPGAAGALPRDWGFFAGTMFWGRVDAFAPLAALCPPAVEWEAAAAGDGQVAHAVERLFGLAPLLAGLETGAVVFDGRRLPRVVPAQVRRVPILQALAGLDQPDSAPHLSPDERALVTRANPLLHYLTAGAAADFDPNPLFANAWYRDRAARNTELTPLAQYRAAYRAFEPSPRFRGTRYLRERPWLQRRGRDPLTDFLSRSDWREAFAEPEPETPARDWRSSGDAPRPARGMTLEGRTWSIAIKIATPREAATEWGDVHFANGLAAALGRLGHRVRVDRRDEWYDRTRDRDDVVIVLRGPARYEPEPDTFAALWIISHPDQVGYDEIAAYDAVFVASRGYAALLRTFLDRPIATLYQATDADRFVVPDPLPARRSGLAFVGNTRGADRPVVRWAIEGGFAPALYGAGWDVVAPELVRAPMKANEELPALYAGSVAVLNDHWPAMRDFGIASNRLFDVLAATGVPVSDAIPSFEQLVPGAAIAVAERAALPEAVAEAASRPAERRVAFADIVRTEHSFDRRAAALAGAIRDGMPSDTPPAGALRVHVVFAGDAPDRDAFRRLLSPFTLAEAGPVDLSLGPVHDLAAVRTADRVIVQSRLAERPDELAALLRAMPPGRPLIVDCPDGIDALPRELAARVSQIWLPSDAPGVTAAGKRRIVPDAVDPRLWRDYHRPRRFAPTHPVRFALLDPPDGPDDVVAAFAALGERRKKSFELWLPPQHAADPAASFVRILERPKIAYPLETAWMRAQPLDVALCLGKGPTADVAFLEASALGLLSVTAAGGVLVERRLALAGGRGLRALTETLERIIADPRPFAAVAAAAQAFIWEERSAILTASRVGRLLRE